MVFDKDFVLFALLNVLFTSTFFAQMSVIVNYKTSHYHQANNTSFLVSNCISV